MQQEIDLPQWKQHALLELSYLFASFLEYQHPGDAAARLEGIARELREYFTGDETIIPPVIEPHPMQQTWQQRYQPGQEG